MKRLTEKDVLTLKHGTRIVFMDRTGCGCKGAVHGEVYKLTGIDHYKLGPTILTGISVKTGAAISAYHQRFSLQPPMMEENE